MIISNHDLLKAVLQCNASYNAGAVTYTFLTEERIYQVPPEEVAKFKNCIINCDQEYKENQLKLDEMESDLKAQQDFIDNARIEYKKMHKERKKLLANIALLE